MIRLRYERYPVPHLGYATVRDYVDSFEHLKPLASVQGDLKDVQRPWLVKAILSTVPPGGRLIEIGGGQPYVADLLSRLGYEVWLVDPYDGSGNGPLEFERFRRACPNVRFVRALFDERLEVPESAFDCVFSISVLEHLSVDALESVVRATRRFLAPSGRSLHAVDHVSRGVRAKEDAEHLRRTAFALGSSESALEDVLRSLETDPETYFLSAESYNRWRIYLGKSYDEYPMFSCVSIHIASQPVG